MKCTIPKVPCQPYNNKLKENLRLLWALPLYVYRKICEKAIA